MNNFNTGPLKGSPVIRRESDDAYPTIIIFNCSDLRVINCKDNIQWIVQRKLGSSWRSRNYLRRKAGLLNVLAKYRLQFTPEETAVLEGLPDIHP